MDTAVTVFYILLTAFTTILALIVLSNWRVLRRLGSYGDPANWPRVSVLIPARDEQENIGPCVRSLLAQEYRNFEVLVLDDHSSDGTAAILAGLAREDARLRVLQGQPLPPGWLGKHWACHQLSQAAAGDLLLFTDADTRHGPRALCGGVAALQSEGADLLTAIPREEVCTWAEKLAVPLVMQWGAFAFVPLALVYRLRLSSLAATVGQYMLFRKEAYAEIGGFAAIRREALDDLTLGRRIVAGGYRWRLADATRDVQCRMYRNARQVIEGFSKNLFAGFDYRLVPFLASWLGLLTLFALPAATLLAAGAGARMPSSVLAWSAVQVTLAGLSFALFYRRFALPLYLTLCYPLAVSFVAAIAFRSAGLALNGRSMWKGRSLVKPKVRLL